MKKRGYTLVEVVLVIALTCLLFVAFLASIAGTLASRRYIDSTNDFANYLRTQYSQVINVQSAGSGATRDAIYGRVIFFGLDGDQNGTIYSYDIIGAAIGSSKLVTTSDIFDADIGGNIIAKEGDKCYTINQEIHEISNGAWLETERPDTLTLSNTFKGTMFIIRNPYSGAVTTKFTSALPDINYATVDGTNCNLAGADIAGKLSTLYRGATLQELNFCIASDDQPEGNPRRDIRIVAGGNSTSAVQVIALDEEDNRCDR